MVAGLVDHADIFAHFLFDLGDPVAVSSRKLCVGNFDLGDPVAVSSRKLCVGNAPILVLDDFELACDSA